MRSDVASWLSVLLLDPRPVRARTFADSIKQTHGLTLAARVTDLSQAYHLTEHQQPDLVIVAEEETRRTNFAMYDAMLEALEIDCVLIGARDDVRPATRHAILSRQVIEATGGLGPYLIAHRATRRNTMTCPARNAPSTAPSEAWKTVVIGASTGGVEALIKIMSDYPASGPPTLVVQHISARFLPGLAQRLDRRSAATIRPARSIDRLEPGLVLLAPGNAEHLTVLPPGGRCRMAPGAPVSGHRPSVDALFNSAARLGPGVVGVLLSGMGRDGAEGLAAIRQAGGMTIAQNEATSTVYGMPRAAQELGAVQQQLPIDGIAKAVLAAARSDERIAHG